MKWTRFMDMHSGGGAKENWEYIYIEAPQDEAVVIFYNKFGHNPSRVTCTCCGDDYSISEEESLEQATAFERNCKYAYFKDGKEISKSEGWVSGKGMADGVTAGYVEKADERRAWAKYVPLEKYLKSDGVLVIYDKYILPEWRKGNVPEQGYVWVDGEEQP